MPEGADAATELRREHDEIESLATRLVSSEPGPERIRLVREISVRFLTHAQAEERYLYPALRRYLPEGPQDAVLQTRQDDATERIMQSIEQTREDDAAYESLVNQLVLDVQRHIEQQDSVLLPALVDHCSLEEINHLGRQLRDGLSSERSKRAERGGGH